MSAVLRVVLALSEDGPTHFSNHLLRPLLLLLPVSFLCRLGVN